MEEENVIGKKIEKARALKGYSLEELSNRSNVSITLLSLIIHGKKPKAITLVKIANALDLDANELLENLGL